MGVSANSGVLMEGVVEGILVDGGRVEGAEASGVEIGLCGEQEHSRKIEKKKSML